MVSKMECFQSQLLCENIIAKASKSLIRCHSKTDPSTLGFGYHSFPRLIRLFLPSLSREERISLWVEREEKFQRVYLLEFSFYFIFINNSARIYWFFFNFIFINNNARSVEKKTRSADEKRREVGEKRCGDSWRKGTPPRSTNAVVSREGGGGGEGGWQRRGVGKEGAS